MAERLQLTLYALTAVLFSVAALALPVHIGAVPLSWFALCVAVLAAALLIDTLRLLLDPGVRLAATGLERPSAVYLAAFALAAVFTRLGPQTAVEAYKTLAVLAFAAAVPRFLAGRDGARRFVLALTILGGVLSAFGLLQYLDAIPKTWWDRPNFISSVYVNHNHFAGFLELVLPLSLGVALAMREPAKRVLVLFCSALMGVAFLFTLSRGGYVALGAGGVVFVTILRRRGLARDLRWVFTAAVLLGAAAAVMFGLEPVGERIGTIGRLGTSGEMSFAQRLAIWKGTLAMIGASPVWGHGPGTFETLFLRFRPPGFFERPGFAHNDYLQTAADLGLVGLAAATFLYAAAWRTAWNAAHRDTSRFRTGVAAGAAAGLTALAVHALVDFNFHIPANWALVAVVAGLAVTVDSRKLYFTGPYKTANMIGSVLAALVLLAGGATFGISDHCLRQAVGLKGGGSAERAGRLLDASVAANPWNAEALYRRGQFHAAAGRSAEAERDLARAVKLDPSEPYYEYHLGRVVAEARTAPELRRASAILLDAVAKDPSDPRLAFLAARTLFRANTPRDAAVFETARGILAGCVRTAPGYAEPAYRLLWTHDRRAQALDAFYEVAGGAEGCLLFLARNDLWAYYRRFHLAAAGVAPRPVFGKIPASAWSDTATLTPADFRQGWAPYGEFVSGETLFRNGELLADVSVRSRAVRIFFYASGTRSGNSYPYLAVKWDGRLIDGLYLDYARLKNYEVHLETEPGRHTLSVEFLNDHADPWSKEDRNARLKSIRVQCADTGGAEA